MFFKHFFSDTLSTIALQTSPIGFDFASHNYSKAVLNCWPYLP